ncbi:MAG: hypothetical protein L0214_13270 [candidate division NC10 bacterium]|nr:hypothetical protein [candidate division NC10 bacterium]
MAERTVIGWSPVVGPIYLPNGGTVSPAAPAPSYMRSLLAHYNQQFLDAEFHEAQPVTLAASATRQEVVAFRPGAGRLGICRGVAMGVQNLADFDNIVWAITVDDASVPGFESIRGPFGVFVYPKPVLIMLAPDQRVAVVASNLTALAIPNVTAYLMGTHWPMEGDA